MNADRRSSRVALAAARSNDRLPGALALLAATWIARLARAEPARLAPAACPDSFSVCAAPNVGLGHALVAVPAIGAVLALVGVALLLLRRRPPKQRWPRGAWAALALGLVPIILHARFVAPGHVVYYDEFLHAETTANLADRASPHPCCRYEHGRCVDGGPIMWPVSTQIAAAALMRVEGGTTVVDAEGARRAFNRAASVAAPPSAWLWTYLMVGDPWAAAVAGLALAVWPGTLRLQSAGDLTPGTVLFLLLLMSAIELWRKRRDWGGALAVVGFMALAFHGRLEMALVTPWIAWRLRGVRAGRVPAWVVMAVAWPVIVAPLAGLYLDGVHQHVIGWSSGWAGALGFLRAHAPGNLRFFVDPSGAAPALAALAVVGMLLPRGWRLFPLALTAAGLFLFESAYHIGDFRPGDGPDGFRFAVPIAVLLLPFVAVTVQALRARLPSWAGFAAVALAGAALLAPIGRQRAFLARPNIVEAEDALFRERTARHPWSEGDLAVTRSVAYTHAMTGARDVIERCSLEEATRWLPRMEAAWYVRAWGDAGPTALSGLCAEPVLEAGAAPDRGGPWLFRYGACGAARSSTH